MKIKKFNENVFNNMVDQRITECIQNIGDSFNVEVKDKEAAKKDLVEFLRKHYTKRNQDGSNESGGEFYF